MRGDTVIVRSFQNIPLIRRIWDERERVVDLVSNQHFDLLLENNPDAIGPVGFPKEDVFIFDAKFIKSSGQEKQRWEKLKPVFP